MGGKVAPCLGSGRSWTAAVDVNGLGGQTGLNNSVPFCDPTNPTFSPLSE